MTNKELVNREKLKDKFTQLYIDNQYDFSKYVLTITEPTKLQGSLFSVSLFSDEERVYIRNRLKILTQIGEIIYDEEVKDETINYFIEDLFNLSILSRTKKAWLIKQILQFAKGGDLSNDDMPSEMIETKPKTAGLTKKVDEL